MRLLFDQNISYRITKILSKSFPEVKHVSHVGLEDATDTEIWEFARSNDFSIVTFDSDYYDLSIIKGCPPKIIWLRTGNTATKEIAEKLEAEIDLIKLFLTDTSYIELSCLEID
jgi:predicted nuclease of predicted toxin-antitoxin system